MKFKLILLYTAVTISTISYLPHIYLNPSIYSVLRLGMYVTMLMLILYVISIPRIINNKLILKGFISLVIIAVLFLTFYACRLNYSATDLVQTMIPLCCVIIGYCSDFSTKDVNNISMYYIVLSVVVAYVSSSAYTSIRNMGDYSFLLEGKNQIGAIAAISMSLSVFLLPLQSNKYSKLIICGCLVISLVASYIIGCRSSFLSSILFIFYVFTKRYLSRVTTTMVLAIAILIFISIVLGEEIFVLLKDFFVGQSDINNLNDVSSGRMDRNYAAINFILNNFFTGELLIISNIPLIHNYLLLKLVRYGIFALLFIYVYFLYFLHALRKLRKDVFLSISSIGYAIIIIPYVVSLLEPGAPFGPGSLYFFPYILYGYSLSKN